MEFYEKEIANEFREHGFQFPTGWNSTLADDDAIVRVVVSIPNGMEFYQRAGAHRGEVSWVSIPNGMEFYP